MSQVEVDKVIPQSGTTLTLGDSADTITIPSGATLDASNATVTIPAVNLTTGVTGTLPVANGGTNLTSGFANGITMADQWRLTTTINGNHGDIVANLERNDTSGYGGIGTGMTERSGIFTFPSTGIYLVTAQGYWYSNASVDYMGLEIRFTTNNSTYVLHNFAFDSSSAIDYYANTFISSIFDVTDTSNCKVKFSVLTENANSLLYGQSDKTVTGFTFIRLGDT